MTPPIAILGAGPAGLMLGRLLELAGIDYTIFERDESAAWANGRGGSGTLDIRSGSGQLALEKAGLLAQFKALARHNVSTRIADAAGNLHLDVEGDEDDDKPEIDRRDLRELLLESVPAEKVQWNRKVESLGRNSDGSTSITFADGSKASSYRLVVGADGAWSKARALVTPSQPSYRGITFLTTKLTPASPQHSTAVSIAGHGIYIALGGEKSLVVVELSGSTYYIGTGMRLPQDWRVKNAELLQNADALRNQICENFEDWSDAQKSVIKHSDGAFHVWPQWSFEAEQLDWQPVPGVTLIGDAAHLTIADGQGVNSAMFDSHELAQQIINHGLDNLDAAVAAYEQPMLQRSRARLSQSLPVMQAMFSPNAPSSYLEALMGEPGEE